MEKFKGLNVKIWTGNFWNYGNYFPKGKVVELVHGTVDRVHSTAPWMRSIVH
jgi:hypothetical protein